MPATSATHASSNINDEVAEFANIPPPPYPGDSNYDLTPTPHSENRQRLPTDKRNPFLKNLPEDTTIVKFQTIVRENKEIVVGRIKVPTPGQSTHAFILRRYDTNAISLTTMFKVAFPGATEEEERREMEWVRSFFDTSNTNGPDNGAVRLAGQWVSRHLAIHLSDAYGISELVAALARAIPDPNVVYRKSQRSLAASQALNATAERRAPSMTAEAASPASKRQRVQPEDASRRLTLEATTTVMSDSNASVNMEQEIESAKQLVNDLKRELRLRSAQGEQVEDPSSSRGVKRGKEDDVVVISSGTKSDRIIRTNRRIEGGGGLGKTAKTVAWGAVLFGLGAGVTAFFPQLATMAASYF